MVAEYGLGGIDQSAPPIPAEPSSVRHPGFAESFIPVWGSGREAVADVQDGDYLGAALNGALAASDLFLAGSLGKAVAKGAFHAGSRAAKNPHAWRNARRWMGKNGWLKPFEEGHHWAVPQGGWGKNVPGAIKNQPWNIKGLPQALHQRIHRRWGGNPQFNPAERIWVGTPTTAKVAATSAVGHPAGSAKAAQDR